ncbi:AMP-binding protein [Streptosporangium sp. NPDC023615]|uniref:AMP-binding protein n=1 Tax=Streptosporangium sp. NPDC023615 TaxID=3154794 RepID=UPI00343370B1
MTVTSMFGWFARSAAEFPGETALEVGAERLTYAELSELVDRCAGRILERLEGRVPGRVGLLCGRTVSAYAGYLSILRLGATPVPLNLGFPEARNAAIARAAALDLVVHDGNDHLAPTGLDLGARALAELPPADLPPGLVAGPDDLAYILFTSGSTGTPKGVPLAHRNVVPFVGYLVGRYPAGPGARISQAAELTFDPSVHDMFLAWATGAALVVPSRQELLAPVEFINRKALTHWYSVPSIISSADRLGELRPGRMPGLRWSMFAGEPLTLGQARAWRAAAPNSELDNIYGPTELAACCDYRLPADPEAWPSTANGTVPIGVPYTGMEHVVVDGELLMRGSQRFPGYLDPADNAGRFLVDGEVWREAATPPGDAWYRTGDLVEERDGLLVHCGRGDQQLKIRGYRVELGEIEAVMREVRGVRDAVVAAHEGELRAAYTGAAEPGLLDALAVRLPAYMIPNLVEHFDELPMNFNGKIDRALVTAVLFDREEG